MKILELNQMEKLQGGGLCDGQAASFAVANVAFVYSIFSGPIGVAIATTAFTIALYNLNTCMDQAGE